MRYIKTIIAIVSVLTISNAFAHKDRIERPMSYLFIFQDNDTIILDHNDSLLKSYSDDIVNGKSDLVQAELVFETGEKIIFKKTGIQWTEINISNKNKFISIPDTTTEKISAIHFATVALVWDGRVKQAFKSSYFYIRFEMGTEKSYDKFPELRLKFSRNKFSSSIILRQINEKSQQWKYF